MSEVIEFLRSRERAAFELWRNTPADHPHVFQRAAAWENALRTLNGEINARLDAAIVRTAGRGAAR